MTDQTQAWMAKLYGSRAHPIIKDRFLSCEPRGLFSVMTLKVHLILDGWDGVEHIILIRGQIIQLASTNKVVSQPVEPFDAMFELPDEVRFVHDHQHDVKRYEHPRYSIMLLDCWAAASSS